MLSPLANPTFRKLYTAQVVSLIGTGLSSVALALLAWDLAAADAAAVLGTVLALKMVAYVGIAPVFGGWLEKISRKRLLISLDLLRAGLVLCLPFIREIWQIYVVIFLLNACSAGFTPAFQATIPNVLRDSEEYTKALSLSRLAYDLENLLSPVLAAAALMLVSFSELFFANAVAFLLSAAFVARSRLSSEIGSADDRRSFNRTLQGLLVYLRTPRLRALFALSGAVALGGAMVIVNTVVYVQGDLQGSPSLTATVLAAFGAGSMAAALLLPMMLERMADRQFMLAGGVLLGLGLLCGVGEPGLIALLPTWFLLGVGSSMVQTPAGRLLTRSASEADRSMVFAAQFALSHACWLVAYPLAGWLGSTMSFGLTCGVLALLAFLTTVAAWKLWLLPDNLALKHEHLEMEHCHLHVHDDHHQHDHLGDEDPEPHSHPHKHPRLVHTHPFVIDLHHRDWPR